MTSPLSIERAEQHQYQQLFIHDPELVPPRPAAHHHRIRRPACHRDERPAVQGNPRLGRRRGTRLQTRSRARSCPGQASIDRIPIFHDDTSRSGAGPCAAPNGNATTTRLSRHRHRTGDTDPASRTSLRSYASRST